MRDLFVTAVVFGSLPFILRRPYVGIYVFSWLGYMNPQRLAWGFAYNFPFSYLVAVTTLIALLFSREPKKIPWTRETVLLLLFVLWMVVTTSFAFHQAAAWVIMEKVAKIQLMIFITLLVITNRERLHMLIWVIALSLGFYGVKGGIFTIVHGGVYHVQGPEGSFIGGNNEMALALIMAVPLMRYLQLNTRSFWLRQGLAAAMLLCGISIVGSQSRGALIGLAAMGLFLWLKSRNKIATAILMAATVALIAAVMPQSWYDRMATIDTYQEDDSAMGRINAWHFAFNLAKARPLIGGGFECFKEDLFDIYAPDPGNVHDAHSIYFEVLGEQGFVGLALFLALGIAAWRTGSWVIRKARGSPGAKWAADLAGMAQVSLIGYASGGAFLGLSNFDLYYHLLAVIVLSKVILLKQQEEQSSGRDTARAGCPGLNGTPGVPLRGYRR